MAKFTIGIPTYNRCKMVQEAISCACNQLGGKAQVIVVDNGSTDDTARFLAQHPYPNLRVHRYETNQGVGAAWAKCVELAETEYFSWLQDDDMLHPDFLRRAEAAFDRMPEASTYLPFAARTHMQGYFADALLYGPPVKMSFDKQQEAKLVPSAGLIALSYFCSVGTPPAMVFRRKALADGMKYLNPKYICFAERSMLNGALLHGPAIADAYVGAIYHAHAGQESRRLLSKTDVNADWLHMARQTEAFLETLPDWKTELQLILDQIPPSSMKTWVMALPSNSGLIGSCEDIKCQLIERYQGKSGLRAYKRGFAIPALKSVARELVPPIVWKAASKLYSAYLRRY